MNKLAIVGHPSSGLEDVELVLLRCGMQKPLPSKREGMSPRDIASTLLAAHECTPLEEATAEEDFMPIEAGPVWHGMALDLMLGNLDHPFWGWADPNTLYLLNYWYSLDPQVIFVLVYDRPQRALLEAAAKDRLRDDNPVDRLMANWTAYNGALLQFYLRHQSRCMLVSADQVRSDVSRYIDDLQHKLRSRTFNKDLAEAQVAPENLALPANVALALRGLALSPTDVAVLIQGDQGLEQHLVDQVVQKYPEALQLFLEMQAAASLPSESQGVANQDVEAAWLGHAAQRCGLVELISRLCERVTSLHAEIELQRLESLRMLDDDQSKNHRLSNTNDQLLSQLNQVQATLEQSHAARQQVQQALSKLETEVRVSEDRASMLAHKLERLETERDRQVAESQQLLETERKKALDLRQENESLLSHLHQVQEALEQAYLENQQLKSRLVPSNPMLYGAADRVKSELAYRLGARLIAESRTLRGRLSMFQAIRDEARAYRVEHAADEQEERRPINEYADYHEGERVKRHLSYRLGTVISDLDRARLRWLRLPLALLAETQAYRSEMGQRR